jgi:hypothetical protein
VNIIVSCIEIGFGKLVDFFKDRFNVHAKRCDFFIEFLKPVRMSIYPSGHFTLFDYN